MIASGGALALLLVGALFSFQLKQGGGPEEEVKSSPTKAEPPREKPEKPALLIAPFDSGTAREKQRAWATFLGKSGYVELNSIGMEFRKSGSDSVDFGPPSVVRSEDF